MTTDGPPATTQKKGLPTLAWVAIAVGGGIAVVVALVAAIFAFVWSATSAPADAANAFLAHVGNGRYEQAYRSAAPQFRAQHSLATFSAAMKRYGVDKFASAAWSSREISAGRATLSGTITVRGDQRIPATVVLVGANEVWRVYSLTFGDAGVNSRGGGAAGTPRALPDAAAVRQLVQKTLLDFNDAVRRNDFSDFHATLAAPMRAQYTAGALAKSFESFIRNRVDIDAIRSVAPVYASPPAIDGKGLLRVRGYYPTRPARVSFSLAYMMEAGQWRAINLNISAKRAP